MSETAIIVPCRWASTRFPGKAVAPILGKPAIRWVIEACEATGLPVYLATDDKHIAEAAGTDHVIMTGQAENGTARCSMALNHIEGDRFIIVPGDEIAVKPKHIEKLFQASETRLCHVMTLLTRVRETGYSHAAVSSDQVLYISHQPISNIEATGIYCYKREALEAYTKEWKMGPCERREGIELLRPLENWFNVIGVWDESHCGLTLNYPTDVEAIEKELSK